MSTTSTDPIADMLSRIRNAIAVRKNEVVMPHSKIKQAVAEVLVKNNYLDSARVTDASIGKSLHLSINPENRNARITEIVRISTPGRRNYSSAKEIPAVKSGRGIIIVSTSKGLMTGAQAKTAGVGGELICRVY